MEGRLIERERGMGVNGCMIDVSLTLGERREAENEVAGTN